MFRLPGITRRISASPALAAIRSASSRSAVCVGFDSPLEIHSSADGESKSLHKGQVRVKVAAAAINFADILQCKGQYQEKINPPFVPGAECSGEIIEVSEGTPKHLSVGDKVICFGNGGAFSSHMLAHGHSCIKIPPQYLDHVNIADGAALIVSYGTAHLALTARGQVKAGDVVLVTAAGGGVGLACCELASNMGAHVIAAAGSESKIDLAASKGALPAGVNYTDCDGKLFRQRLKEALHANDPTAAAKGVDVFVDNVGGDFLEAGIRSMNWNGRAVVVGFAGGKIPSIPANILLLKNVSVNGLYWGAHMMAQPDLFRSSCSEIVDMWGSGKISPHISHKIPIEDVNEALRLVSSRESTGKVIVTM